MDESQQGVKLEEQLDQELEKAGGPGPVPARQQPWLESGEATRALA